MALEKIQVRLELISDSFMNRINKANKKMKNFEGTLKNNSNLIKNSSKKIELSKKAIDNSNYSMSLQKERYIKMNNQIRSATAALEVYRTGRGKLSSGEKSWVASQKRAIAGWKQEKAAISNNIDNHKKKIISSKRGIKSNEDGIIANMGFFKIMRLNGEQFRNVGKKQDKLNKKTGRYAFKLRKAIHGMKGFKMEMLGVMFFGMAMSRMFLGMLKTSTSWLGVWELLSIALGILFLPLAKKLLDWTIKFLKWVTKLTPSQKKFWNQLILVGIAVGLLLTLIGTLALGLASLVMAFGFLFSPIGLVISSLVALGGFLWIKNLFSDVGDAAEYAEGKLMSFGMSGESLTIIKDKMADMLEGLSAMKDKWFPIGVEIAGKIVNGIVSYFINNPLIIIGAIAGAFLGGPAVIAMGAAIGSLFSNIKMEKITALLDSGLAMLDTIIKGVIENISDVEDIVTELAEKLTNFVTAHLNEFIEIGFRIGAAIVEGIISALGRFAGDTLKESAINTKIASTGLVQQNLGEAPANVFDNFITKFSITLDKLKDIPFNIAPFITPGEPLNKEGFSSADKTINITNNFNGVGDAEFIRMMEEYSRENAEKIGVLR